MFADYKNILRAQQTFFFFFAKIVLFNFFNSLVLLIDLQKNIVIYD